MSKPSIKPKCFYNSRQHRRFSNTRRVAPRVAFEILLIEKTLSLETFIVCPSRASSSAPLRLHPRHTHTGAKVAEHGPRRSPLPSYRSASDDPRETSALGPIHAKTLSLSRARSLSRLWRGTHKKEYVTSRDNSDSLSLS